MLEKGDKNRRNEREIRKSATQKGKQNRTKAVKYINASIGKEL